MSSDIPDLHLLRLLQASFAATLADADPRTPVPWCGRWRVENLADHLTRIHHWAAAQARREHETPLGRGRLPQPEAYRERAEELVRTLEELDPVARAWTLLDDGVPRAEQRGTVAFWHRRQSFETLVHLWDLRTALGLTGLGVPALSSADEDELWWDCIDEVVTVMHPRQVRLGRVAPPTIDVTLAEGGGATAGVATVGGETVDGGEWRLVGADDDAPAVRVVGTARDLALLVWGRAPLTSERLRVEGDDDAQRELLTVLAAGLTP